MSYSKDKLQQILDNLIDGTKKGYITWKLINSMFNSDTRYNMHYISDDGKTEFRIDIRLENDLSGMSGATRDVRINNDDLVDGYIVISGYDFNDTKILADLVYRKFVRTLAKKNIPKQGVLDSILNNINIQQMREDKIDDILSDEDIESIEQEAKELVEKRLKEAKSGQTQYYKEKMTEKVESIKEEQPKKRKKFLGIF